VSVTAVDHASLRLNLLLFGRFVCVLCFLSTNLSSSLVSGCRLLLLFCCLIYVVCVLNGPLPSNRLPTVARVRLSGDMFIELLPSNGSVRHNTKES
jgi:hypothetical protein